ncbi:DNA ligase 4 isoform X2 [Pectinophora gossypiella]|uniref:DNA ligase 4 isoform X2 n=1 Tax=Pectinophora gossypiella TaxID=13191 RepID=UPI00214E197E|nr:DNA ligase 4 isoform X2 [Pectinophora gossypiella]
MATAEVVPANDVLFSDLCGVLDDLFKRRRQIQVQNIIIADFVNKFKVTVSQIGGKKNSSFFPILRLLLPDRERERPAYNLKERRLAEMLVKVLAISKTAQDAQSLLNFRSKNSQESDFAGVAYFVVKNRIGTNPGKWTIGQVNEILDKIATAELGRKWPILDEAFSYALKNMTAEQVKWFLRIILKDLKLGMGTHRILAAFHPDAPDLFDTFGNLKKIHMENGIFEYFSRKGFKYSDCYGKTYDSGLLTPLLKNRFAISANSFILDGEMMGWHKQYQCFSSKGMAFDVKKITENSKHQPCFCAFDILYYNGKALVGPADKNGLPLSKRLEILRSLFDDLPGVIMHSKSTIVCNRSDVLDALNNAIDDQEEGIVVKDKESYYIPNKRGVGWYKIKPEYTKDTMEDLDLVIIGAEEAQDKRNGWARSFHVACADVDTPGAMPSRWVSVGKVASGLSFEERERICAALDKHRTPWKQTPAPPHVVFNKEKPDFWITPEHSIVLQVRATELIRSTDFGTPYTLRFPRVVAIRDDKPVKDCMTLNCFNRLVEEKKPVIKLSNKRINQDQIEEIEVKTQRKRKKQELQVAEKFRNKVGDVTVMSGALAGRKLCVLSGDEHSNKPDLVRIIEEHGGKHVENTGLDTWCCVVGNLNYRARSLIQSQELDIVTTSWLRNIKPSDTPCDLSPLDMLSIKKSTRQALSRVYDTFWDSYTKEIDEETLKKCFEKMEKEEPHIYLTNEEMLNLDKELYGDHNPFSYLRPCFIHFVDKDTLLELKAKMYGANVHEIDSPYLTHIVISKVDNIEEVKEQKKNTNAVVVSDDWLRACFTEETLVSAAEYLIT